MLLLPSGGGRRKAVALGALSGLAFAQVLEQAAKLQYDVAMDITLQQALYVQWGPPPIGGLLDPTAIGATGLLAFFLRKSKRGRWTWATKKRFAQRHEMVRFLKVPLE